MKKKIAISKIWRGLYRLSSQHGPHSESNFHCLVHSVRKVSSFINFNEISTHFISFLKKAKMFNSDHRFLTSVRTGQEQQNCISDGKSRRGEELGHGCKRSASKDQISLLARLMIPWLELHRCDVWPSGTLGAHVNNQMNPQQLWVVWHLSATSCNLASEFLCDQTSLPPTFFFDIALKNWEPSYTVVFPLLNFKSPPASIGCLYVPSE